MWIGYRKYKKQDGSTSRYPVICEYLGGGRRRVSYIRKVWAPVFMDKMVDHPPRRSGAGEKFHRVRKAMPPELKTLLEKCGYSVRGSRISRDRKTFSECASARFEEMLDENQKAAVVSPERMLHLELRAQRILKSWNRRSVKGTYEDAMGKALLEQHCACNSDSSAKSEMWPSAGIPMSHMGGPLSDPVSA